MCKKNPSLSLSSVNLTFIASCNSQQIHFTNIRLCMSVPVCLINIMAETIYKIYRLRRQENKLVTDSNGISDAPRDRYHVSLTYFLALEYNSRVIREKPINLCRPTLTESNINSRMIS